MPASRLVSLAKDKFGHDRVVANEYNAVTEIITGRYHLEEADPEVSADVQAGLANKGKTLEQIGYDPDKELAKINEQYQTEAEKARDNEKRTGRKRKRDQTSAEDGDIDLTDIANRLPKHPCSGLFCSNGFDWHDGNATPIIDEIMNSIEDHCSAHDGPITRKGRSRKGIKFSLTNEYLRVALQSIFKSGHRLRSRIEASLERFIRLNLDAFPEMRTRLKPLPCGPYDDTLKILQEKDGLALDLPLTVDKAEQTAEAIFDAVERRFKREAPESARFREPKGTSKKEKKRRKLTGTSKNVSLEEKYSLAPVKEDDDGKNFNFKDTLKACFAGPHGVLEALEVEVYRLAELEHKAFPELSGWPTP
ncbi:hypothetical protein CLAFUW4_10005 [Fulvia fulva]|nr:hypothetical protein CLAFUR4_10009 [Fulvia fulva]WPV19708.1 hypothetical protein CLAFUW4_10005 [Fulvia fulva]WPV34585.1 hypothetical protein CLAFUW7_10006 [Fulvia fulva]